MDDSGHPSAKRQRRDSCKDGADNDVDNVMRSVEELDHVQSELEQLNDAVSAEILEVERRYNQLRKPVYHRRNELIATIPRFWQQTFENHDVLRLTLTRVDREILHFLRSMNVTEAEDVKSGFEIKFDFDENPFFSNAQLEKQFRYSDEGDLSVTSTRILWKNVDFANDHPDSFFVCWFADIEQQDEIGEVIKDSLWPNPLCWFMQTTEASSLS